VSLNSSAAILKTVFLFFFIGIQYAYAQQNATEQILYNGKIYTCNPAQPEAQAVAIAGDKIVAVGTFSAVKTKVGTNAVLIDLKGRFLLPGLVDSHIHAIKGGERLLTADLNDELLPSEELAAFAENALQTGKGVRGDALYITGIHSTMWSSIDILDSIFNTGKYRERPVLLLGADGHTAWCNRILLNRAGINKSFMQGLAKSEQKYYGVGEDLEPNGFLAENAIQNVNSVLPPGEVTPYKSALNGVNHLNSLGITAWLDPATGNIQQGLHNEELSTYHRLAKKKLLSAHVVAVVVADANKNVFPQVQVLKILRRRFSRPKNVSVVGFKIFADGVLEFPTQTAAISIPYKNSSSLGSLMVDPDKLKEFVVGADKSGLLVHIHAIGDRAVSKSLDAIGEARKVNGNKTIPHSITHLQIVKPEDANRFAGLNVLASMQLLWATADRYTVDLVKPYIDSTLYSCQYPAGSLIRAGASVCGASDWPVSSANPFEAISTAETRKGPLGILNGTECVSRADMIKAYTINAAKVLLMDNVIGSIEPGKQADFVLVDKDIFKVDSDVIRETQVIWTMFGGKIVFQKGM
jgi:predicted amidohydrolase YtcJ